MAKIRSLKNAISLYPYACRLSVLILLFVPSKGPDEIGWSYQFKIPKLYLATVSPIFINGPIPDTFAILTQPSSTFLAVLRPENSHYTWISIQGARHRVHCLGQKGKKEHIKHVGCLVHVRRKFLEVNKGNSKNKPGLAKEILAGIAKVYKWEKKIRHDTLTSDEILTIRLRKS